MIKEKGNGRVFCVFLSESMSFSLGRITRWVSDTQRVDLGKRNLREPHCAVQLSENCKFPEAIQKKRGREASKMIKVGPLSR